MRIAICDDEKEALESLQGFLEQSGQSNQIEKYLTVRELQDAIGEGQRFDLIFMDIEWNERQNGVDFASAVNEHCPDTQIIFITGHPDRFYQQIFLKPVNLCGYLSKPIDPIILDKLLKKALSQMYMLENQKLLIQYKGTAYAVPIHKIGYLESRGHQLTIHTTEGNVICCERLEKLRERLPGRFLQCHKSYLVNMDFIRRIEKSSILLKNGSELPVSKAKYAETRTAFFRYMGKTL